MPPVTFILGRAGSGKSRCLQERIAALLKEGQEVVLLVPEQFTFETERELSERLSGLMNVSVFSFTTLSRRVLRESGEQREFLSRQGRRMVIRRSATELENRLGAFKKVCRKPGFSEQCDDLFSLFKRFEITPPALQAAAEHLEEGLLRQKTLDLALLYADSEEYLASRYLDSEDAFNALVRLIPTSFLAGKHILIDGFDLLTEQIYSIIETLMTVASSMTVSVRIDPLPCRDEGVFAMEKKAYARLYAFAKDSGYPTKTLSAGDDPRFINPALAHLEHEAFAYPYKIYPEKVQHIRLFAATDRTAEVSACADAVLSAAKRGVRYRDMAVVATDMESYAASVSRIFSACNIPFFTDAKHPLAGYGAARLPMLALRCTTRGFAASDITELIKTGFTGLSQEEAEALENHLLQYGLRGASLTRPFTKGQPIAEQAREKLMEPLLRLRFAAAAARTADRKTEALYSYIKELELHDRLARLTEELKASGQLQLMEENAQVFNRLMELFDQLHAILGPTQLDTSRYLEILTEGVSAYEVGAIPTTADQVLFGSVGRTRARSIRALFLLGATEGSFPRICPDDGVIDDTELARLAAEGLTPWDSSRDRSAVAAADAYSALAKPSEELYISYPLRTGSDPVLPAAVVERIKTLFPQISVETDLGRLALGECAATGFPSLIERLHLLAKTGKADESLPCQYAALMRQPLYAERLHSATEALYYDCSPEPFGKELARELYGGLLPGSPTRLETYNACPFQHFAKYALKALPRKEYKERSIDSGSLCHEALAAFVERIRELDAASLTDADTDAILDELLPPILFAHNDGILQDTARDRAQAAELTRIIKTTARAVRRQLAVSAFTVQGTEVTFGLGSSLPPLRITAGDTEYLISGKIDRLDTFQDDSGSYYRVVDYKQGNKQFDYADLYYGLKLQLPLYIRAALAANRAGRAAGFYYQPIRHPVLSEDVPQEDLAKKLFEEFRLNGLTLNELNVVAATRGNSDDFPVIAAKGQSKGLVSEAQLQEVAAFAERKAADTLASIMEGSAEALPYRKKDGSVPCTWCDYPDACEFDPRLPSCSYRSLKPLKAEDFLQLTAPAKEEDREMD